MNRIALALLASAAALASAAHADTRFSIGINVGGPVHPHLAPPAVVACPPTPPPTIVYAPARGYWKEVVVKTWVPERWVSSRDRFGRLVRICEPGYHTYRTERVWVDGRPDYDRHDRRGGISFSYDSGSGRGHHR